MNVNKIYCGDNVAVMREHIPNDSIDLTVTSPPYDNLRKYNGFTWDFEGVANELLRVTKPGGVVVWVVGDATVKGSETGTSFRQALRFMEIGFNLHDTMIYVKDAHRPRQTNRYEQAFEFMLVLSKGRPMTTVIRRIPCKHKGIVKKFRSRDCGGDDLIEKSVVINDTKNDVNVWKYSHAGFMAKDKLAFDHPASFPEALAADHILSWSNPGDLVFDPFCGSGTTLKMAKTHDRRYIGIDVSSEYTALSEKRVALV